MTENSTKHKVFKNSDDITAFIAEEIKALSESSSPKTIALSGGSTPKAIFRLLAKDFGDTINWQNLHFFWVDERCVPHSSPESNYGVAHELLFSKVAIPEQNIHPVNGEKLPEEEAKRYSAEIAHSVTLRNGIPQFDLILLGMGTDGHTASIFPPEIELINAPETCVVGTNPESKQKRISLSGTAINNAEQIYFIVTGAGKKEIVSDIFNQKNNFKEYPASFIIPKHGKLQWLLDEPATPL